MVELGRALAQRPTGWLRTGHRLAIRVLRYIGYEFSSKYWRQGLGSSSVRALLDELASTYQVHTIVAVLKKANYRSTGLLRKLAFSSCPEELAAEFEAEADEIILVKRAGQQTAQSSTNAG